MTPGRALDRIRRIRTQANGRRELAMAQIAERERRDIESVLASLDDEAREMVLRAIVPEETP